MLAARPARPAPPASILLFSHDRHLAPTRHWVLEQAHFQVVTVYTWRDLEAVARREPILLFLLCNSLPTEVRQDAADRIRGGWPYAKILVFLAPDAPPVMPADAFFPAMKGPGKLLITVRTLMISAASGR